MSRQPSGPRLPVPQARRQSPLLYEGVAPYAGAVDYAPDHASGQADLKEVFAVLRRHALAIAITGLLAAAAAAAYVFTRPPQYSASAIVRLKDVRGAMTAGIGDIALDALVTGRTTDPLLSELEILRSPAVAEEVIRREGLRLRIPSSEVPAALVAGVEVSEDVTSDTLALRFEPDHYTASGRHGEARATYGAPVDLEGIRFIVSAAPDVDNAEFVVVSPVRALEDFFERLDAQPRDETDVVDVQYRAEHPELAQRVVNTTVSVFQALNTDMAQQQSRRRRQFVEEQLQNTDSMLAAAQLVLSEFRRREQVYSSSEKFAAEQTTLMGLDVRREELDAERRMYASLLGSVQETSDGQRVGDGLRTLVSSPGIAANPVVAPLFERLVRYQASLDSMTTGTFASAPNNPDVRTVQTLLTATRGDLLSAVRSHVQAVDARIAALDDLKGRATAQMQALPETEAEEVRLVLQLETVKNIADQLREEYQKARVAEVAEAGQVEILSQAREPEEPVPAYRGLKVGLALLLGLVFGSGGAFLREHLNTSIGRKEEVEEVLQVPALGIIPQFASGSSAARRLPGRNSNGYGNGNGNGKGGTAGLALAGGLDGRLVTITHHASSGAEAYRTLRTNLIFSQAVQSLRTLVVTSSAPAEGKTTTASNLAIAFAQQGMRVLLADCDLRRSTVHKVFRIRSTPGFTELTLGQVGAAEAIRPTAVAGLYVLPAGTPPPNPSEFLGSERTRQTIADLGAEFDVIVLDTPPVLAASDATVLASRADGVVVVIRAGQTERGAAQHTMQQLEAVGARVVGAVLNDPDAKVPRNGGYYSGYYSYTHEG